MMSNSLIKLIDSSLLPASFMIAGKFFGLMIAIRITASSFSVSDFAANQFLKYTLVPTDQLVAVSTYSDIVLLLIMSVGVAWQLFSAVFLHQSHISPKLLSRLVDRNWTNLIKGSYNLYHAATMWVAYFWVTTITIVLNALLGKTNQVVALIAIIFAIGFTAVLLRDVYEEIKMRLGKFGKLEALS